MRNWVLACLTVLGVLAALMTLAAFLSPRRPRIDRERYDSIAEGMPRRQVEALLGQPRNDCGDRAIVWVRRGGKLVSAVLRADPAEMTFFPEAAGEGVEAAWVSEAGLIAARFGPDGRLQQRHFSTVHVSERPSWVRDVARLFRR
jgi:hypothetical protein